MWLTLPPSPPRSLARSKRATSRSLPTRRYRAGSWPPGLEMVIEIDPDSILDPGLGVPKRIPETGRMPITVEDTPVLDLTVIPFLWSAAPDSGVIEATEGMRDDPDGHALLEDTRILLPVRELEVTAHDPVASTSNDVWDLLEQTNAVRALEGAEGHHMGMMSGPVTGAGGVAFIGGRTSVSTLNPSTIAHELGHNMSLLHAPCGGALGPDPLFPDPNGQIGAWGYDFGNGLLVQPHRPDLMGYCGPRWISGYHFTNALAHRLADEGTAPTVATAPVRSLLLWGGVDADGEPFLNPAFVVEAPAALPDSTGDYTLTGRDAGGGEIFSLSFPMPEVAHGDGRSSFAFVLPMLPERAGGLASVTLSGTNGCGHAGRRYRPPPWPSCGTRALGRCARSCATCRRRPRRRWARQGRPPQRVSKSCSAAGFRIRQLGGRDGDDSQETPAPRKDRLAAGGAVRCGLGPDQLRRRRGRAGPA